MQVLLDQHDDGSALWLYTQALVAFKVGRDDAAQIARDAFDVNRYIPAVLARKKAAAPPSPFMTWGGEDEAAYYVAENQAAWSKTPGAIDWLLETTKPVARAAKSPKRRRPMS